MGFFDSLKAAVGIGQPKVEIKLENSVIPRDHGYLKGEIIVTAQENAEANYVKLEFFHIERTTRDIISNGKRLTEEFNQERLLYRIIFQHNHSKSFERLPFGTTEILEQESGVPSANVQENKISLLAKVPYRLPFNFTWHISNSYKKTDPHNRYSLRASVDMPGLDPRTRRDVVLGDRTLINLFFK